MRDQIGKIRGYLSHLANFVRRQYGVVTVEWVALAAALVIGAVTIAWLVATNVKSQSNSVGSTISDVSNTTTSQPHP